MKKFVVMGLIVAVATAALNVKKIEFQWENPLLNK